MEIKTDVATGSHPTSRGGGWVLTEECKRQLVAELPGKPVTFQFGRTIGVVTAAVIEQEAVHVTLEISEEDFKSDGWSVGPKMECPTIPANDPSVQSDAETARQLGPEWHCSQLGAWPR